MFRQIRHLLALLAMLLPLAAFSQSANFTADVSSGCDPLVVNFTNTTGCSGCTYNWDFGNGGTSTLSGPVGTSYTSPGTYTVTLVCHNGATTTTKTMTITVYPRPTVNFTADDTAVCPGTPVTFTSTSVGGVPGPMTYSWNFGDGGSSTLSSPTHTFPGPGYYNITLSVTNSQGCTKSLTKGAYIHVYDHSIPNFTASSTYLCNPPATITFTGSASGAAPFTYLWDFGDGSGLIPGNPASHTYATTGYFTIKMIVTDANGCKDTLIRPSYIHIGSLNANFTYPTTVCQGTGVVFTNTSDPHTSSYWNFGDGMGTSADENPIYGYSAPGTYVVSLTISDGTCTRTVTHTITVIAAPTGTFTITPERPCPPPVTLSYSATVSPGASVAWSFGDGGTASGNPATHTYGAIGVYTVTMTMTNAAGCTSSVSRTDTMYNLLLMVGASPISGCVPLTVNFTAYAYHTVLAGGPYPYGPNTYSWNYGDGSSAGSGSAPTHTYTAAGTYYASCTVTTGNGCTKTQNITIEVGTPPSATFTATPTHVCYGKTVTFTPTIVTGPVDTFIWNFGDGGTAITSPPGGLTYTFILPGVFSVTLTPQYHGCKGAPFVINNYITVDSPKAVIADSFSCVNKTRVYFKDKSYGDDTHLWMFGDGATSTSTLNNPIHDYPAYGTYTVTLATYNATSGCRDTTTNVIHLLDLNPTFVVDDSTICKWGTAYFTSTVTGGTASGYRWWKQGITQPWKTNPNLLDTFLSTGTYNMMLVTWDEHNCTDTARGTIKVAKPVANFNAVPTSGCWPLNVVFTDASTDIPGVGMTTYEWSYGDGAFETAVTPSVTHLYTLTGVFDVTEVVTDDYGCKDTVTKPSYITVHKPSASFSANQHPCRNAPVLFSSTSTGGIVSYYWWFGDGATSTLSSPTHAYSTNGTYTVKLAVTDAFGCHDTATYTGYEIVHTPTAAFTMSDSFSVCPPLNVNFTNGSSGATGYTWYFGDGSSAGTTNPSNLYISTGAYTVMLVASNAYGCKDTARRSVTLFGYAGAFGYAPLQGCSPLTVHFTSTVTNATSITWDFADGIVTSTPTTITDHVYTTPGKYIPKLILSDNTGCQNSSVGVDTIKVDIVTPKFVTSVPACLGAALNFVDSSKSYFSTITGWNWSYDGNTSSSPSPSYTFNTVGTYPVTLIVTDGWGCTGTVTTNVVIDSLPTIEAHSDTVVCVGDHATLWGSGGVSYVWAADPTLSCTACDPTFATPTVPTTYTVTGTDAHGCTNTDTARVSLRTHTFAYAWPDTAVCRGTPVPMFDTGGTKYTWIPALGLDNPHSSNPLAVPPSTQTYTVIAQLASCIPDTDYVTLTIWQLPTVDAGVDQRLLAGTPAQLSATGTLIDKYFWSPSGTLSCNTCANPVATMDVTTSYKVDVLSNQGCPASDSVTIFLYCDNSQIFIPNSFTPNGDGQNDIFYPRGKGVKNIKTFRIYNRWGELVFQHDDIEANDPTVGWDGSYKGDVPRPDVYVYLLEADCSTGEPIKIKGDITIIR